MRPDLAPDAYVEPSRGGQRAAVPGTGSHFIAEKFTGASQIGHIRSASRIGIFLRTHRLKCAFITVRSNGPLIGLDFNFLMRYVSCEDTWPDIF